MKTQDTQAQDTQEQVFAFLADPATHGGAPVRRINTHAASVFLAAERAFKVKRAVRFPFLDYSTLDRRHAACAAEMEVNQPFAPELYLGVVAITRERDGRLAIGGSGMPVEWAVAMRRFDETRTLDLIADAGGIDLALADALARAVARAHPGAPNIDVDAWIGVLTATMAQNDAAFREDAELFAAADAALLGERCRAALERLRPLLGERGECGRVRRGHGDLHLGNIALIDGRPVPFDALEFDPLMAAGDFLYDLSFLLMDLLARDLPAAASVVLNRYLVEARREDDLDMLAALPLFMALRAAIRAKVTAARRATSDASQHPALEASARAYFRLATALIAPPPPHLIAIGGLSGTGKSALARDLAPEIAPAPGAVLLRADVERKAHFGVHETERLPADAYAPAISTAIYTDLARKAARILRAGHSATIDAVFSRPHERGAAAAVAAEHGVAFHGLFLTADLATRIARVGTRSGDASDADESVARAQEAYDIGALDWAHIDASGSQSDTLARARAALTI